MSGVLNATNVDISKRIVIRSENQKPKNLGGNINHLNDAVSHGSSIPKCDSNPIYTLTVNSLDSNESQSAYIQAQLGDCDKLITTTVLVDTGSDYDVIDLRLLNRLRQNNINCTLLKPKRRAPLAANNIRMTQIGDVVLDIKAVNQKFCNHYLLR